MQAPFKTLIPLILASASPRRSSFLQEMGLDFRLLIPDSPEPSPLPGQDPADYAAFAARHKAFEAAKLLLAHTAAVQQSLIISADTIVVLENSNEPPLILGKPKDKNDAQNMLCLLSGRSHMVITACCLLKCSQARQEEKSFTEQALVRFAAWPREVLQAYANTGDSLDKAGAYGIQGLGAWLVESIEGSWSTVAGLPMSSLTAALLELEAIIALPSN